VGASLQLGDAPSRDVDPKPRRMQHGLVPRGVAGIIRAETFQFSEGFAAAIEALSGSIKIGVHAQPPEPGWWPADLPVALVCDG
jgi:hypothetical protein